MSPLTEVPGGNTIDGGAGCEELCCMLQEWGVDARPCAASIGVQAGNLARGSAFQACRFLICFGVDVMV